MECDNTGFLNKVCTHALAPPARRSGARVPVSNAQRGRPRAAATAGSCHSCCRASAPRAPRALTAAPSATRRASSAPSECDGQSKQGPERLSTSKACRTQPLGWHFGRCQRGHAAEALPLLLPCRSCCPAGLQLALPAARQLHPRSLPPLQVRLRVWPAGGALRQVPRGHQTVQEWQAHRLQRWLVPQQVWHVQGGAGPGRVPQRRLNAAQNAVLAVQERNWCVQYRHVPAPARSVQAAGAKQGPTHGDTCASATLRCRSQRAATRCWLTAPATPA